MKLKKEYLIVMAIQITEVLGFSLVLPFLPLYAEQLGASPLLIGLIMFSFSFFQFWTSPIMGKLSDHYGRKPLLIFSQISTVVSFIVLGFANTVWMIIFSRIIDGLLGSNFTIAQAYLSDVSSKKDRSKVFGLSGVAFGFGFLIGPAIGGYLATVSSLGFRLPSFIAAGISLVTIILTMTMLKETVKEKKKIKINFKLFNFDNFKKYFSNPMISPLLWQFFLFLLSHFTFTSQYALFVNRQYGMGAQEIGFLLAFVGLNSIIMRGVLLSKLIDFFGEKRLLNIGISAIIIGDLIAAFARNYYILFGAMFLFSFGAGVIRPLIVGEVSRKAHPKEQGAVLGVTNSLGSVAQMISPLVGGYVLSYYAPMSLPLISAFFVSIVLFFIIRKNNKAATY